MGTAIQMRARKFAIGRPVLTFEALEGRAYFAAVVGAGKGLVGDYFSDQSLTNLAMARTDTAVNFSWPGSPGAGVPADRFGARWTGQVLAPYSQAYTFYTSSCGGVRLWVDNKLVINNWTAHALAENKGTVSLTAGAYYDIKLEYFENGGTGSAKLSWSGTSTPKQIIPTMQLYRLGSDAISAGWLEANIGASSGSVQSIGTSSYTVRANDSPAGPPAANSTAAPRRSDYRSVDVGQCGVRSRHQRVERRCDRSQRGEDLQHSG